MSNETPAQMAPSAIGPEPMLPTPIVPAPITSAASGPAAPVTSPPKPWSGRAVACLLLCLLLALGTRATRFDNALNIDELWIVAGTTGHVRELGRFWNTAELNHDLRDPTDLNGASPVQSIWFANVPAHPPLHTILLRLWRQLLSPADAWARAFSTMWSLISIAMVYAALRLQFDAVVASCAGLVLALSPIQAHLGTEIRSYSMVMALIAIATFLMVRMERMGATKKQVWSLGLLTLPMMLSHYFAIGSCMAIAAWGLLRLRGVMRRHFIMALLASAAVFTTAWLPLAFKDQWVLQHQEWLITKQPLGRFLTLFNLPERLLLHPLGVPQLRMASVLLLGLVAAATFRDRRLQVWTLMLVVPLLPIAILDLSRNTEHIIYARYCSFASIGLVGALVAGSFSLNRRLGGVVFGLLMITMLPFVGLERDLGSPRHDHMIRTFAPVVLAEPDHLPLASISGETVNDWQPFFVDWARVPGIQPRSTIVLGDRPSRATMQALKQASPSGRFWLISYGIDLDRSVQPVWMKKHLQGVHPVKDPWLAPAESGTLSARQAMSLWLMEFDS